MKNLSMSFSHSREYAPLSEKEVENAILSVRDVKPEKALKPTPPPSYAESEKGTTLEHRLVWDEEYLLAAEEAKVAEEPGLYVSSSQNMEEAQERKSFYEQFVSYAKSVYEAVAKKVRYVSEPFKLTMAKLVRTSERMQAMFSPQWNMPLLSPWDLDTLSPQLSEQVAVIEEKGSPYTVS